MLPAERILYGRSSYAGGKFGADKDASANNEGFAGMIIVLAAITAWLLVKPPAKVVE